MIRYFLFLLLFSVCTKKKWFCCNKQSASYNTCTQKFLTPGESYTMGKSVTPVDRFPAQTVDWLRLNRIEFSVPDYIATKRYTTSALQNNINTTNPASLCCKALFNLQKIKSKMCLYFPLPVYSVTPSASNADTARIRLELDWFNTINKQVTDAYKTSNLNITPSTRRTLIDRYLFAANGLVPFCNRI